MLLSILQPFRSVVEDLLAGLFKGVRSYQMHDEIQNTLWMNPCAAG